MYVYTRELLYYVCTIAQNLYTQNIVYILLKLSQSLKTKIKSKKTLFQTNSDYFHI